MVTDKQVRLLRLKMAEGKTVEAAAAAAGMSARSAHTWKAGTLPSQAKQPRHWRTREDAFATVWDAEVVPLLERDEEGILEATTIIGELRRKHGQAFTDKHLRTLQRRVRDWRALQGPEREVFFEQEHLPGREAAIDFTDCSSLGVRIAGELFAHLLFQFLITFSRWRSVTLAFSETFEALVSGLQDAFWRLGGVPEVLRSDNLSAATHELPKGGRELNQRFAGVLDHYQLRSTRIEPGKSNQNGAVEKANHLLKSAIEQALIVRGNRDFAARTFDLTPSGRLVLTVGSTYGGQKWSDTAHRTLEAQLGKVILGVEDAAEEKLAAEERAIKERDAQHMRDVEQVKANYQHALVEDLEEMVARYERARSLRAFLHALEVAVPHQERTVGFAEWVEWAEARAAELDPLMEPQSISKVVRLDFSKFTNQQFEGWLKRVPGGSAR